MESTGRIGQGVCVKYNHVFAAWPIDTMYMEAMQKYNKCHGHRIFTVVNN